MPLILFSNTIPKSQQTHSLSTDISSWNYLIILDKDLFLKNCKTISLFFIYYLFIYLLLFFGWIFPKTYLGKQVYTLNRGIEYIYIYFCFATARYFLATASTLCLELLWSSVPLKKMVPINVISPTLNFSPTQHERHANVMGNDNEGKDRNQIWFT